LARCPLYYNGRILPMQGRTVLAYQKVHFQPLLARWEDWGMPVEGSTQSEQGATYLRLPNTIFLLIITVRDNDYPAMSASEKIKYVSACLTDTTSTVYVPAMLLFHNELVRNR